jgi:hypothetical protein
MTDPISLMNSLRRPRLLVRAARLGIQDYNRDRCLRRLYAGEVPPKPGLAFEALVERELALDQIRREGSAAYSVARHIELLIALIEESRLAAQRLPRAA